MENILTAINSDIPLSIAVGLAILMVLIIIVKIIMEISYYFKDPKPVDGKIEIYYSSFITPEREKPVFNLQFEGLKNTEEYIRYYYNHRYFDYDTVFELLTGELNARGVYFPVGNNLLYKNRLPDGSYIIGIDTEDQYQCVYIRVSKKGA